MTENDKNLFTKLRTWCLADGSDSRVGSAWIQTQYVGPLKWIYREFESNPEALSISVCADTKSEALEIVVTYNCEGRPLDNPVTCITKEGKIIRTHGDFNRVREWVESL